MKTAVITCLFLLIAGIAAAQDHPSRKNAQNVKATQATEKNDAAPAPSPQPANRSINEKGLSTPVNSSAPKKQTTTTTPQTDKKEEKMQAKPQE